MTEQLMLFSFLLTVIVASACVMVLSITQMLKIKNETHLQKQMRRLRKSAQPAVTVVMYTHNQAEAIEQSLRSLLKNRYHAFDIVVVDDGSSDETVKKVKAIMARKTAAPLTLLRRRKVGTVFEALKAGYRKSKKGAIVIPLAQPAIVDHLFIKRVVAARQTRDWWKGELPQPSAPFTITGIVTMLEKIIWLHRPQYVATTAQSFLKQTEQKRDIPYQDIVTSVQIIVLMLLLVAGFITGNFILLWYGWIIITAYLIIAIWLTAPYSVKDKLLLTFSSPSAFILLPVTSFIKGIFQFSNRK